MERCDSEFQVEVTGELEFIYKNDAEMKGKHWGTGWLLLFRYYEGVGQ